MRNVWSLKKLGLGHVEKAVAARTKGHEFEPWVDQFFLLCAVVILFSFVCAASANALFSSLGSFLNEMVPPVLWMIYIETLLSLRLFRERSVCFVLVKRECEILLKIPMNMLCVPCMSHFIDFFFSIVTDYQDDSSGTSLGPIMSQ